VGPAVFAAAEPLATTKGASSVTPSSATLNGLVAPRGLPAVAWVEWGATATYDNATAPVSAGTGWKPFSLAAPIAGLAPGHEYHYRVVAQNSEGTKYGDDAVFTTTTLNTAGILWVDLRANDPTAGTSTWKNYGALGDFDSAGLNLPAANADADGTGIPGVEFDGFNTAYASQQNADPDFSWNSDRTVEVRVLDPAFSGDNEAALALGSTSGDNSIFKLGHGSISGLVTGSATRYLGGIDTSHRAFLECLASPNCGLLRHHSHRFCRWCGRSYQPASGRPEHFGRIWSPWARACPLLARWTSAMPSPATSTRFASTAER